jgi:hypothetical protein
MQAESVSATAVDALKYFAAVIRGKIDPSDRLSSLKNT